MTGLAEGSVYRVRDVFPRVLMWPCGKGSRIALTVQEQPERWGWCACMFRPLYNPKREFIEGLKEPAPGERVKEPA